MTKKGSKKTEVKKTETDAPKKTKQLGLPAEGMARKRIPELDTAAEAFRAQRDKRMKEQKLEKEKKTELLRVAKKYDQKVYVYESEDGEEFGVEYEEETVENVKVKKIDRGDDE